MDKGYFALSAIAQLIECLRALQHSADSAASTLETGEDRIPGHAASIREAVLDFEALLRLTRADDPRRRIK